MFRPSELAGNRSIKLHNGVKSTTDRVWAMLEAGKSGDVEWLEGGARDCRELLTCMYDYTSPLHLSVLGGHGEAVRFLVENGALDPGYRNHPFLTTLPVLAVDRGQTEIASFLIGALNDLSLTHEWGDAGGIDYRPTEKQRKLQSAVDKGACDQVRSMLENDPGLIGWPDYFWGEGILSVPSNSADFPMLELLIEWGARVPDSSKWGARYYFKHLDVARFLLEHGMNPNHRNWRQFTLLHDMGFTGDTEKANLLIENGADLEAVDDEYSSTALGYAAQFGHPDLVHLLLEHGADPNAGGADWATPLAWAEKKGHAEVLFALRRC